MKKFISILIISLFAFGNLSAQYLGLNESEIFLGDRLISNDDFVKNGSKMPKELLQSLVFKPKSDGDKVIYYINGNLHSKGKIEKLQETGIWKYWHSNGKKAREGEFVNGKPNGTHKYWYENGNLRGIGNWKNGAYDGKWEMYSEDGNEKTVKIYQDGKQIE